MCVDSLEKLNSIGFERDVQGQWPDMKRGETRLLCVDGLTSRREPPQKPGPLRR